MATKKRSFFCGFPYLHGLIIFFVLIFNRFYWKITEPRYNIHQTSTDRATVSTEKSSDCQIIL